MFGGVVAAAAGLLGLSSIASGVGKVESIPFPEPPAGPTLGDIMKQAQAEMVHICGIDAAMLESTAADRQREHGERARQVLAMMKACGIENAESLLVDIPPMASSAASDYAGPTIDGVVEEVPARPAIEGPKG